MATQIISVDYTTLRLESYDSNKILNNTKLDFSLNVNEDGVVTDNKRIAKYHFCKIIVYDSGSVYFEGSLHKMYNSLVGVYAPNYDIRQPYNGFNGNTFTYENLCLVILHLESLFSVDREYFTFRKIEIGLNLLISVCPRKIITNLLNSGGKKFEMRYKENFAQVEYDDFYLKIYNKGFQFGMDENILRIEIKTKRMREFSGIRTLADLTTKNLDKAILRLSKRWNDVLLYDCTINENNLSKRQRNELKNKFRHTKYWTSIKSNNKHKPKKRYFEIVKKHSENLHKEISDKIKMTKISQFN